MLLLDEEVEQREVDEEEDLSAALAVSSIVSPTLLKIIKIQVE